MTQNQVIENNKLIALFMGAKYSGGFTVMKNSKDNRDFKFPYSKHPFSEFTYAEFTETWSRTALSLQFNESWSWLMPVVEKIEKIQLKSPSMIPCRVTIERNCCYIHKGEWNDNKEGFISCTPHSDRERLTKIKATWLAVVAFIEWYNENKKK